MRGYRFARAGYRRIEYSLVRHLPERPQQLVRTWTLRLARRLFGTRIQARSATELAARSHFAARMPEWAEREIRALTEFEPALRVLTVPGTRVEAYSIPWDKTYLGEVYAKTRRKLGGVYGCMILAAGAGAHEGVAAALRAAPQPVVVIDPDAAPALRELADAAGVEYLALPKGDLDTNDRAFLLTRLVLQLRPTELRYARHEFLDVCLERHGLAMAAVSRLQALPEGDRREDNVTSADPQPKS